MKRKLNRNPGFLRTPAQVLAWGVAALLLISGCGGGGASQTDGPSSGDSAGSRAIDDTSPPTVPSNVKAGAISDRQITLTWSASTDDVAVTGYKVYQNGAFLRSVAGLSVTLDGLTPSTQYCYAVSAYDASGNESTQSSRQCATTLAAGTVSPTFTLTLTREGTGSGTVNSSPLGVNCGSDCIASFTAGAAVTLSALPDPGSVLTGWEGDCTATGNGGTCSAVINGNRSVTAIFTKVTAVSGAIRADAVWTVAQSPYLVTGAILIEPGTTLTIEPGVVIRVKPDLAIRVDGGLVARGTAESPIRFTSNEVVPTGGDWGYIQFTDSSADAAFDDSGGYLSGSILEHCIVEYAGRVGDTLNAAVRIENSAPFVNQNTIQNNAGAGLRFSGVGNLAKILGNTVVKNGSDGIVVSNGKALASIHNNMVSENKGAGISIQNSGSDGNPMTVIDIRGNLVTGNKQTGISVGAGVYHTTIIAGNTISDNTSPGSGGGVSYTTGGGANYATINANTITDNTAGGAGGGIFIRHGFESFNVTILGNTVSRNRASVSGGGIAFSNGGAATVSGNVISGNTSPYGSALDLDDSLGVVVRNTITENVAVGETAPAGAIMVAGSRWKLNRNNIFQNTNRQSTHLDVVNTLSSSSSDVDATNNWWGVADQPAIDARIYDFFDNASRGRVISSSFLTGPLDFPLGREIRFAAAANHQVGLTPEMPVTGDFNGDGHDDLAVANFDSNTVSILLNTGTGSFGAAVDFPVGVQPLGVAVADFNGDTKLDLAVTNYNNGTGNTVSILLGNRDGTFGAKTDFTVGSGPLGVVVGDFNEDGNSDLAVANSFSNTVSILLGMGNGSFAAKTDFTVGSFLEWLTVADFNRDGHGDLAVTNFFSNRVAILLGTGSGSFSAATYFSTRTGPSFGLSAADFDEDGKIDLAITNLNSNTVSILAGNGAGAFGPSADFLVGRQPRGLALADFNGDSELDIAVANFHDDTVHVLLGTGAGTFALANILPVGDGPFGITSGDFNNDGKPDLATANELTNNISVLIGQ